ncbi:PadR family transcriptional regulator, regulatory protein PadR [Atopostipes suicloacalis DSM 15692]|uniref:PadR family transcriptional regulator, regulatory protein PadR n=2 Tax=Atopostipes suicloacalis TaxID=180295 RepID=A0A1M4TRA2_9LACT|nr:PadR family transcriptional regulator, regulatory protein PadR [Atopostipes suicloacalis DSM 15692]
MSVNEGGYTMIGTSNRNNPFGEIKISTEVLEVIVGFATLEVNGVYGMRANLTSDLKTIFGRSEHTRGVSLQADEFGTSVDVYCYFNYGVNVPYTAQKIQENVKEQVYHMTEIELDEVHVHIVGIIPEETTAIDVLTTNDLELGEEI